MGNQQWEVLLAILPVVEKFKSLVTLNYLSFTKLHEDKANNIGYKS